MELSCTVNIWRRAALSFQCCTKSTLSDAHMPYRVVESDTSNAQPHCQILLPNVSGILLAPAANTGILSPIPSCETAEMMDPAASA